MKKLILLSTLIFSATSVMAQEDKIASLDVDMDGRISVEEAVSDAELSAKFSQLDTNKDGYLSPSELAEH
ncbi:hypothetical protein [Aliiglaciecola sp. LCG003]|uniref:hypothetical protein n=1 Tax=Aliiglaciecola sp. LCG003 TaxID=3053655 RepID=UPI0025722203|nr:hypothetical protein [Aliiglaciecola sp. LCG003]WJG11120.1 hypothetical protein QR722_08860 [Aliiglaciecola sp. LCG003]